MELSAQLGNEIITRLSSYVETSINLMDSRGVIIASTDHTRVGRLHGGAVNVCETREPQIIHKTDLHKFPNAKTGVNLPVYHRKELAGVVGMTGDPASIMQTAKMTLASVEIVLEQIYLERESFDLERLWLNWLRKVLLSSMENLEDLKKEAEYTLQIDVEKTWQVIISRTLETDFVKYELKNHNIDYLLVLPFENYTIAVLEPSSLHYTIPIGLQKGETAFGNPEFSLKGIIDSYNQAREALEIFPASPSPVYSKHIPAERLLYNINENTYKNVTSLYSKKLFEMDQIYISTLQIFLQENMKINSTSSVLHIHRNTLNYRLDRIQKQVSLNPREFRDAIIYKTILVCANA
ncbi:CdaR family transcriptional regulator [Salimicrobium flavidum]|uniref:Transcriptional regulator, CdaR family n=1 Tax=Salimicrobium flavidum TaxID=570947 RepID=A0A1N7IZI5_9BACI|nr:sugar diacid recognition domain-containing protein [Salimicrobium flavidum]SIS42528.1 transcriptional regulator, CdaR family [Salimicrobium flavidum]